MSGRHRVAASARRLGLQAVGVLAGIVLLAFTWIVGMGSAR